MLIETAVKPWLHGMIHQLHGKNLQRKSPSASVRHRTLAERLPEVRSVVVELLGSRQPLNVEPIDLPNTSKFACLRQVRGISIRSGEHHADSPGLEICDFQQQHKAIIRPAE
jgi:hypothetical protein